jgi:hypothetical protein
VQHGELVAKPPCAVYVVGHHQDRHSSIVFLAEQELVDLRRGDSVQAAARFVREKNLGLKHERPRETRSLSHSARQTGWKLVLVAREADMAKDVVNREVDFGPGFLGEPPEREARLS